MTIASQTTERRLIFVQCVVQLRPMSNLTIRQITLPVDYQDAWHAMRQFTDQRDEHTPDEAWLMSHPPVFTQGQAGKAEHILNPGSIPVVQSDRGGQVTYHGPGQLVIYTLIDLKRLSLTTRDFVRATERALIQYLADIGIAATARIDAPGIYVDARKLASIGLRVRRGRSYHGIALNVDMDLSPFNAINPCGFKGLEMTQISDHRPGITTTAVATAIGPHLANVFGYTRHHFLSQDQLP